MEQFIPFDQFSTGGITLTDTFDTWRQKNNGMIVKIAEIETNTSNYAERDDVLLLNFNSPQTVSGPVNFSSSLSVGTPGQAASFTYSPLTSTLTLNQRLSASEISTGSFVSTNPTIVISDVSYTWPETPADANSGYFKYQDGNITFVQLDELAAELIPTVQQSLADSTVTIMSQLLPVGSIIAFEGSVTPPDWLPCDGTTRNRTDYPELSTVFGGSGTTFTLPDLRSRVLVGANSSTLVAGDAVGSTDLTTDTNSYYVSRYIIKAKPDNTVTFKILPGNGISLSSTDGESFINLTGGTASLRVGNEFGFNNTGNLQLANSSISTGKLASASVAASNDTLVIRTNTGQVLVPEAPTASNHAASKRYVDTNSSSSSYRCMASCGYNSFSSHPQDGAIFVDNEDNILTYGTSTNDRFGRFAVDTPARGHNINPRLRDASGVKKVYADNFNTYILYDDHKTYALGRHGDLNLKSGVLTETSSTRLTGPRLAFNGEDINEVICSGNSGSLTTYAVSTSGALWVAGNNASGQFGDGTLISTSTSKVPFKAINSGVSKALIIGGGSTMTGYYISTDNRLFACGYNANGQCGRGSVSNQTRWLPVLGKPTSINSNTITRAGTTYTRNNHGFANFEHLIDGSIVYTIRVLTSNTFELYANDENAFNSASKLSVNLVSTICQHSSILPPLSEIYAGSSSNSRTYLFVKTLVGELWAVGSNSTGAFGLSNTLDLRRAEVCSQPWSSGTNGVTVKDVYTDTNGTVHIVTTDARLWGAGNNALGQVGVITNIGGNILTFTEIIPGTASGIPSGTQPRVHRFFSINSSSKFCVFKNSANQYFCTAWGSNANNKLGTDAGNSSATPTRVYGFSSNEAQNIVQISGMSFPGVREAVSILIKRPPGQTENIEKISGKLYLAGRMFFNIDRFLDNTTLPFFTRAKNI